jgi:predicted NAD/FAD-dependent oxidoreductase
MVGTGLFGLVVAHELAPADQSVIILGVLVTRGVHGEFA